MEQRGVYMKQRWLDSAVFYEVYPTSFYDANGDGVGDISGIIEKLDYISDLGCNAIWLNPHYTSPFMDGGYDVSDYYNTDPRFGTNEDMKRLFDIIASGCGLLVLSPIFLIMVIWIKLDSKGPVFYRQVRVGRHNKDFRIFKFRSMRVGADKGSLVTIGGRDPRITRSGYFIRKYKLDEFPQLINVFKGEMSLVGPRPEVRYYVNYWTPEQMYVLDVRPGITDPASIKFRNENELMEKAEDPEDYYINVIMQEKIKLYLEYVQNVSFWYDIKLIFQTFKVIITER